MTPINLKGKILSNYLVIHPIEIFSAKQQIFNDDSIVKLLPAGLSDDGKQFMKVTYLSFSNIQ